MVARRVVNVWLDKDQTYIQKKVWQKRQTFFCGKVLQNYLYSECFCELF